MSPYLPLLFQGEWSDDGDGMGSGTLRRPPLAKKGRQVLERIRLRLTTVIRQLAGDRAERIAIQRFFRNRKVTAEEIIRTAASRTGEATAGRHVLLIEDTTEIDCEDKAKRKRDLGRVGNGTDGGLFAHPVLAVDAKNGTVPGLAGAAIWRRLKEKKNNYQDLPIEEKESHRWIRTPQMACGHLSTASMVTIMGDREADIYEMFSRLPNERTHLLIRSDHDRAVGKGNTVSGKFVEFSGNPPSVAGRPPGLAFGA